MCAFAYLKMPHQSTNWWAGFGSHDFVFVYTPSWVSSPIACIQFFRMLETKRRERIQYKQIRASGSRERWRGETSERAERQRKNHNTAVFQNGISCAYLLFCYCLRFPFRRYEIFFPLSFSLFVLHNIMHIQVKPYGK